MSADICYLHKKNTFNNRLFWSRNKVNKKVVGMGLIMSHLAFEFNKFSCKSQGKPENLDEGDEANSDAQSEKPSDGW